MSKILFGTDPEMEAVYYKGGIPFAMPPYFFRTYLGVPASDDPRHPVFVEKKGVGKIHEDGANFEMAIRPSHDPLELFETIQEMTGILNSQILSQFPEHCSPSVQFLPTVAWDVERWANEGEDFFMSTRFGCDPDMDVYNLQAPPREVDAKDWPWRYCGGHLHISGSKKIEEEPILAVQCMVITAGLAAVAFSDTPELDRQRTYLYGLPGKFRIQNYGPQNPFGRDYQFGVEYRTPSCRWAGNLDLAKQVLHWAEIGVKNLLETSLGQPLHDELALTAQKAIVQADQEVARELLGYIESKI
jgi:hypothetical protein